MAVYLDHAATAPLRAVARTAWLEAADVVGNPASTHGAGRRARSLLEDAREKLASVLGCEPIEVVFTSGGTESINLALKGLWNSRRAGTGTIVLPDAEHHATMDTTTWLSDRAGATIRSVGVDPLARIDAESFAAALVPGDVAVATALMANNEVGTINDVEALAAAAAGAGVPLHVDAVSAFGSIEIDFARLRGDAPAAAGLVALSLSGHKIGAPVATGALVVHRTATVDALHHGGGGQRALRAGTQDIAGAAALAAAAVAADGERIGEASRLRSLRDLLIERVRQSVPQARLLGDPERRLPGNVHLLLPGALGESMLFLLDQRGVSVSTGAACQAGVAEPSHVVIAMGESQQAAREVIRLTLGRTTTESDIESAAVAIREAYEQAGSARRDSSGTPS